MVDDNRQDEMASYADDDWAPADPPPVPYWILLGACGIIVLALTWLRRYIW